MSNDRIEISFDGEPGQQRRRSAPATPIPGGSSTAAGYLGKTCPYCQMPFKPDAEVVECPECRMPHHADCWQESGQCTTFGCPGTRSASGVTLPAQPAPTMPAMPPPQKTNVNGLAIVNIVLLVVLAVVTLTYIGMLQHRVNSLQQQVDTMSQTVGSLQSDSVVFNEIKAKRIVVGDDAGSRIVLNDDDVESSIALHDDSGVQRICVMTRSDSKPNMTFSDGKGRERMELGVCDMLYDSGQEVTTAESHIQLWNEKGRGIFSAPSY